MSRSTLWEMGKQVALNPIRRLGTKLRYHNHVPVHWCESANWGDALSPILVKLLSGKPAVHLTGLHHERYLVIGSILGGANAHAEVWGSGFIREDEVVVERPRAVHAVRGPLSRTRLLEQGIEAPEVFGDPALLLPYFFDPPVEKRYEVGIIPHYADKRHGWLDRYADDPRVLLIDIEGDIWDFVRAIKSCEMVVSSSLHGLICADAYGVPTVWMRLSDQVIGGGFKFRDYLISIGANDLDSLQVDKNTSLAVIAAKAQLKPVNLDQRKLLLACPFLSTELRLRVENEAALPCPF